MNVEFVKYRLGHDVTQVSQVSVGSFYVKNGQFVAFPAVSQIVMEVELTVVAFTYWQEVTQEELDL